LLLLLPATAEDWFSLGRALHSEKIWRGNHYLYRSITDFGNTNPVERVKFALRLNGGPGYINAALSWPGRVVPGASGIMQIVSGPSRVPVDESVPTMADHRVCGSHLAAIMACLRAGVSERKEKFKGPSR
jgi:hypothetical protein